MGKYIVTVYGTDRKSEILTEKYYVSEYNEDVKLACQNDYKEQWNYYCPVNIKITVIDIEKIYKEFNPRDDNKINNIILETKKERLRQQLDKKQTFKEIWENMSQEERNEWTNDYKF